MEPFTVIIPARYNSTRFPGKPLALIRGIPMICHVVQRAVESDADRVIVATDNFKILDVVSQYFANQIEICYSATHHFSGTSRVQEAVKKGEGFDDNSIIINLQGDEPTMSPNNIKKVAEILSEDSEAAVSSLYEVTTDISPNIVKVVMDKQDYALYFSRLPIPYGKDAWYRHVGIYGYRVSALNSLQDKNPCHLEITENLEQLRFLYYGLKVKLDAACDMTGPSVDVKADIDKVEEFLLHSSYYQPAESGEDNVKQFPIRALPESNDSSRRE